MLAVKGHTTSVVTIVVSENFLGTSEIPTGPIPVQVSSSMTPKVGFITHSLSVEEDRTRRCVCVCVCVCACVCVH